MAETFSGTTGGTQTLQSYAPTVWAQHPNYTQDAHIGVQGQYAQNLSNIAAAVYRCIGAAYAPSSADYDVFADIAKLTGTNLCEMSVVGRLDATASTYYMGGYKHGTGYRLFKLVASSPTQLGPTVAHTLTSTPEQIKLRMSGNQISLLVDDVVTIGPVTDSSITAAGTAGIYLFNMRETGVADAGSLDNFDIANAASPSDVSGNITLDPVIAAGSMASSSSDLSGSVTLDPIMASGSLGLAPGTVSIPGLGNWGGSHSLAVTIPVVTFCRLVDGQQVLTLTNQVTHVSTGDLGVTNAALVPGNWYMAIGWNADGSLSFRRPVLAA